MAVIHGIYLGQTYTKRHEFVWEKLKDVIYKARKQAYAGTDGEGRNADFHGSSPELPKECPDLLGQHFGLLQGGKVPAALLYRPTLDIIDLIGH